MNERARLGGIIWSGAYLWHIQRLFLKNHGYLGHGFVLKLLDSEKSPRSPAGLELSEKNQGFNWSMPFQNDAEYLWLTATSSWTI